MNVFDASALLVYMSGEAGAERMEAELQNGGFCSAANWSEAAQKILAAGRQWAFARALLLSFPLAIEPVTAEDAEWAAQRWRRGEGLSLGDRLCMALGERLSATIWTADRTWGGLGRIKQLR